MLFALDNGPKVKSISSNIDGSLKLQPPDGQTVVFGALNLKFYQVLPSILHKVAEPTQSGVADPLSQFNDLMI